MATHAPSRDFRRDVERVLRADRGRVDPQTVAALVDWITFYVSEYRRRSSEPTARRDRARRAYIEQLVPRLERLLAWLLTADAERDANPRENFSLPAALIQSKHQLRARLTETARLARRVVQTPARKGRPSNASHRLALCLDTLLELERAGIRIVSTEGGTAARIVELIYAEIGDPIESRKELLEALRELREVRGTPHKVR